MIAAPTAVMRAGLESLAASSPSVEIAGSFADLSALDAQRPDVVLCALPADELQPPESGGPVPIVLLSDGVQPAWPVDALRLGVRAVLGRDASANEILAAVEAVANGFAVLDPRELETLLAAAPAQVAVETGVLTPRELEVLRMMAEGAANKTIAWKLGISEHTVKFHVAAILGKLNASSRTEAVTTGVRRGLVFL
jgi:NarL family two-component system response regulator YdfI